MVFVTRADGAEVLFTGDTAWLTDNIDREQAPIKLAFLMMSGADRNRNACQLAALHRIETSEPKVAIMPGHDKVRMQALLEKGVFVANFK
jgi:glyoxylase-like metal-dependent hydrolase (beta-lactamase superfamily II)